MVNPETRFQWTCSTLESFHWIYFSSDNSRYDSIVSFFHKVIDTLRTINSARHLGNEDGA